MKKIETKHIRATLKTIKKYFVVFRQQILVVGGFSLISAVGNGTIPYVTGKFFDALSKIDQFTFLGYAMPNYVALLILWSIVQLTVSYTDWKIGINSLVLGYKARFEYTTDMMSHIIDLPISFHKTNKMGEVQEKIWRASWSIENIFSKVIVDLAPQFLSVLIAFLIIFFINWQLTLFLVFGILIYIIVAVRSVSGASELLERTFNISSEVYGNVHDALDNVLTIKQSTAELFEKKKISEGLKTKVFTAWLNSDSFWNNLNYYRRIIVVVCQIVIFITSIFLIKNGTFTLGDLVAFNAYSAMIFGPFVVLMINWQTIQNGVTTIGKNDEILILSKEGYIPKDVVNVNDIHGNIKFENVSFYYNKEQPILKDISFWAKEGEVIALVGESGVGKSTLIDLISAYHFPTEGKVLIDGNDVQRINLHLLRSKIGVVPQEVVLFNDTIENNIKYGRLEASQREIEKAADNAHALEFIEKFKDRWQQIVGERGIKLSVGQKQRMAIARAILRNPKILILDEPTSALDAGTEKIITQALEELMKGKTTFIIAHRLSTVRRADKILVIKDGTIFESGTHNELVKIKGGEYRRLYDLQLGLHK